MKKVLQFIFNFFWVIFVGISSVITSAVTGAACCLTIVGIPFGLQHFKFIPLVFAPAGKTVVTHYGSHPIMNTLWLLFGGLLTSIVYVLISGVFCITIVGIPIGLQLYKIAKFNLAPFGVEIVDDDKYTAGRNTLHDYYLLGCRMAANPDVVINYKTDGTPITVKEYFMQFEKPYIKFKAIWKKYITVKYLEISILCLVLILAWTLYLNLRQNLNEETEFMLLGIYCMVGFSCMFIGIVLDVLFRRFNRKICEYYYLDTEYVLKFIDYFPESLPTVKIKKRPIKKVQTILYMCIMFFVKLIKHTDKKEFTGELYNIWAGVYEKLYVNK